MESYPRRSRSPSNRGHQMRTGIDDVEFGAREDFGRAGPSRRRSPGPFGRPVRAGRARSRSPVQIDRYKPGPRDDNVAAQYRRRSPPPNPANIDRYVPGQDQPAIISNPMPNPLSMNVQVGFSFFAEWWRKEQEVKEDRERQKQGLRRPPPPAVKGEKEAREERERERAQIQVAYDSYKEKLQEQMAKQFVKEHKDEEWFKEHYDPAIRNPFRQRLAEFRRGNYAQWQTDLESGLFDEFTLEGIYKSESDGAGGVIEKEEGETSAAAEVLGVGDLVPLKGGDLRDEAALQSALLIKTIAPHVSRDKMEEFCKENLGEGDGGFRWLSLSDPNPLKKCHRIGWILLNPGGEEPEINEDERGDGREEDGEEGEQGTKMDTSESSGVAKGPVERALANTNGKSIVDEEKGNFQCHVGVHSPSSSTRKKALWDLFSAPERVERDMQLAMRLVSKLEQELGDDINGVNKIEERVEEIRSKGLLQRLGNVGTKTKQGSTEDEEDGEEGEMNEDEGSADDDEVDDEDMLAKKKKLDLMIEYLRRVFNFCFFCVFESDSVHELVRKCAGGHLRRPRASLTTAAKAAAKASAYGEEFPLKKNVGAEEQENEDGSPVTEKQPRFQRNNKSHQQLQRAFNWVRIYEDKLFQILEPESVDLKKIGGRPLDEALDEELRKHFKQEDEAKFRCRVPDCTKLFKGENFWRKHVEKRHDEWYAKLRKELDEINQYVLDPAHIAPARNDATSNGHFPTNNAMQTGTPRGFNLGNMTHRLPGMPPQPPFIPNLSHFPMAAAPMHFGLDGAGRPGPMRSGPGKFNSRAGGPYDRQQNMNRNPRWGGNTGRLTPPRGGRTSGGVPRFPDAAQATVGPKEATAGRSLKSYEDLDAVGNNAEGQLDY